MKRIFIKIQLHLIQREQLLILFQNGIFRFFQNFHQHFFIKSLKREHNRKTSQKFRDHAEIPQIIRRHLFQNSLILVIFVFQVRPESD